MADGIATCVSAGSPLLGPRSLWAERALTCALAGVQAGGGVIYYFPEPAGAGISKFQTLEMGMVRHCNSLFPTLEYPSRSVSPGLGGGDFERSAWEIRHVAGPLAEGAYAYGFLLKKKKMSAAAVDRSR